MDQVFSADDIPHFVCVLLSGESACRDNCGFPSAIAQDFGGGQMAMGGGGESITEGSSWEPWFTWEQLRNFAQWFEAHPRSAHPEMTDEQYYHMWKQAMISHGLWRE